MNLIELKNRFNEIRDSNNSDEVSDFLSLLTKNHEQEFIEYHYSLLTEKGIGEKLYDQLSRKFVNHGEDGEKFLLQKIKDEQDAHLKGIIIQILGSMKYSNGKHLKETVKIAREFLKSDDIFQRNRASIVIGWIGEQSDIALLKDRIFNEIDPETRGWATTALMQLFYNNEEVAEQKTELLSILKVALNTEQNDFVINCILVSIQEISGKKLGISSRSRETVSKEILEKAKKKATELLEKI